MNPFKISPSCHRKLAANMNVQTWSLLDKADRREKENQNLETFALASLYHWHRAEGFERVNAQRGHWLLARVYCVLQRGEDALAHAQKTWALTEAGGLKDFDLAYALESLARAHAACGHKEESIRYRAQAQAAGQEIQKEENKAFFEGDLKSEPWFGITTS